MKIIKSLSSLKVIVWDLGSQRATNIVTLQATTATLQGNIQQAGYINLNAK
jgi:hypothetical protein